MLRLYKQFVALYIVLCVVFGALLYGLPLWILDPATGAGLLALSVVSLIAFFAAVLALIIVCYYLARREYIYSSLSLLSDQCDPERFLEKQLPLTAKVYRSKLYPNMLFNLASGLAASGRTEEAVFNLESLCACPPQKQTNAFIILAHLRLAVLCVDDAQKTSYHAAQAAALLQVLSQKGETAFGFLYNEFALTEAVQNLHCGAAEAALRCFENRLRLVSREHSLQEQNMLHFYCASACEKLGDIAAQRAHLQFVAQYGNRLHIAAQARQILQNMRPE